MEELFENKTKYSQKEYDIFLEAYKKEYTMSENIYMIFYLAFFGICMVFAFREGEMALAIGLLIGLIVYLWYKIVRPLKNVEKDKKSSKVSSDFINTCKFYKNYFTVENPDGNAQILYFKLYRVTETKTHFYIYISREYAFILSKKGFTKGTAENFTNFIKKKVFVKYKNKAKIID